MATKKQERTIAEMMATRLAEIRKRSGLTQAEFAKKIRVSRSFLSEVENLKSKPSLEMIVGVAAHFSEHADPYWLLLGQGDDQEYYPTEDIVPLCCISYCTSLTREIIRHYKKKNEKDGIKEKKYIGFSNLLHILVNQYMRSYNGVLQSYLDKDSAIQEGEGRASQLASSLLVDIDHIRSMGPVMSLYQEDDDSEAS